MKTSILRSALYLSAASASVAAASLLFPTTPANAADCIIRLDGNDEGRGGARSGENDENLACGHDADASGASSTALGADSEASATHTTAVGHTAVASADSSTALGADSEASATNTTAVGHAAKATENNATALGKSAFAAGTRSIAIGASSTASATYSTAIGAYALASGVNAVAVGDSARAGENSVTVGAPAGAFDSDNDGLVDYSNFVAVGAQSLVYADHATAVGRLAKILSGADRGIAIGSNSIVQANAEYSMALGAGAIVSSNRNYAVALGSGSIASEAYAVSLGYAPENTDDPDTPHDETQGLTRKLTYVADGTEDDHAATVGQVDSKIAVAIGSVSDLTDFFAVEYTAGYAAASATGADSVALGAGSEAVDDLTVSLGFAPAGTDDPSTPFDETQGLTRRIVNVADGIDDQDAVTVGQLGTRLAAYQSGDYIAIDDTDSTDPASAGQGSLAIGPRALAAGDDSVVIGVTAAAATQLGNPVEDAVAIGHLAGARADSAVAIGSEARAYGESSTGVGDYARALDTGAVALGAYSQVQEGATNAVAVGRGSIATQSDTFSVGRGTTTVDYPGTRRIVNVTDGTARTDAATVGQLRDATDALGYIVIDDTDSTHSASAGANSLAIGAGAFAENENSVVIGLDASANNDDTNIFVDDAVVIGVVAEATASETVAIGTLAKANAANSVAIGSESVSDAEYTVSFGRDETSDGADDAIKRRLTHLADGEDDSDAVTVSQLNTLVGSSTAQLGYFVASDTSDYGVASVTGADSVAIGAGSKAVDELTVSFGRAETNDGAGDGITRRLVNVADGEADSDAVTVSQLNAATSTVYLAVDTTNVSGSASAAKNSVALGANASADAEYSLAIGNGAVTNVDNGGEEGYAIAIGYYARSTAGGATALGPESEANGIGSVAFGDYARASGQRAIAAGQVSYANANDAIAIGANSTVSSGADNSIGLGYYAVVGSNATNSLALGHETRVSASNAVAIGAESVADTEYTVSFGRNETSDGAGNAIKRRLVHLADGEDDSDAVTMAQLNAVKGSGTTYMATSFEGDGASAEGTDSLAMGDGAWAQGTSSIAIGGDSDFDTDPNDTIGANAAANYSVAIGTDAAANSGISFALGPFASATGVSSAAIGASAETNGTSAFALGAQAKALANRAVAISSLAEATGEYSLALGFDADAKADYSVAFGAGAQATWENSMAIGALANAANANSMAIGFQAATTRANQIVIGTTTQSVTLPSLSQASLVNAQSGELYMVTVDSEGNLGFATMPGTTTAAPAQAAAAAPAAAPLASNASAPASSATQPSATSSASPSTSSLAYDSTSTDGGPTSAAQSSERIASADDMSSRTITDSEDRNLPERMELADAGGNASETAEQETGQLAQSDPDQNVPEPPSNPDTSAGTRTASTPATGSSELVAAVTEQQFNTLAGSVSSLEGRVSSLESRVQSLEFRLEDVDRRARGGIAAAAALGSAIAIPDKSFVITGNVATYRGETGYAMSVIGRASESLAFSAGIAGNTGEDEVIAQAGFALGF